ncbi:hypothetical protein KM043_010216 [Ampulex compressa]|nr:hypothetical protein KM043_010216 [Ampulex compressa]
MPPGNSSSSPTVRPGLEPGERSTNSRIKGGESEGPGDAFDAAIDVGQRRDLVGAEEKKAGEKEKPATARNYVLPLVARISFVTLASPPFQGLGSLECCGGTRVPPLIFNDPNTTRSGEERKGKEEEEEEEEEGAQFDGQRNRGGFVIESWLLSFRLCAAFVGADPVYARSKPRKKNFAVRPALDWVRPSSCPGKWTCEWPRTIVQSRGIVLLDGKPDGRN